MKNLWTKIELAMCAGCATSWGAFCALADTLLVAPTADKTKRALSILATVPKAPFTVFVLIPLVLQMEADFAAHANEGIPQFTVEGVVSTETYTPDSSDPTSRIEAIFFFSYSNTWWEIELSSQSGSMNGVQPAELARAVINCKRIPDGIRYLATQPAQQAHVGKKGVTSAVVEPIAFPPPEQKGLFVCWLSLCPNPELPIIAAGRIRRLLAADLLGDSRNQGEYMAAYLDPGGAFIGKLIITNNGILFSANKDTVQLGRPFEHGFAEFRYEVVQTTNINGVSFPLSAVLYEFDTRPNPRTRDDVYPAVITRIRMERVVCGGAGGRRTAPSRLIALDRRPTNLPGGGAVNYMVTNDQWFSKTNPRIVYLASIARQQKQSTHSGRHVARVFIVAVLVISASVPVAWLFVARRFSKHKRQVE